MDLATSVMALTGASSVQPVAEGHQSRVFIVSLAEGRMAVAKVLDASLVDVDVVRARVETVMELSDLDSRVCRPIELDRQLINVVEDENGRPGLVVCSEFADGVAFDEGTGTDARLMGETLAGLHRSMARLAARDLPAVAALGAMGALGALGAVDWSGESGENGRRDGRGHVPVQVLHGDFNAGNLRRDNDAVRVFDFDDCGYGPPVFDVANALYMVLFDATVGNDIGRYRSFETAFLSGYEAASARGLDRGLVDEFVDLRVRALDHWLDDLPAAPIGIRTASQAWRATLRRFVRDYERDRLQQRGLGL